MFIKLQGYVIDMAMLALMYYGLHLGHEYAANLFWPVLWVFVFLSVFIIIVLNNKDAKAKLKENRKPRNKWENNYSLIYDVIFSMCLASLGFAWSAGVWFIIQLFARSCVQLMDNEIKEESENTLAAQQ